jgi:quercetin dioxygenase-like cupin family protein
MGHRVLPASDAFWRPSNQMGVLNTDLARQLAAETLGARLWRLKPGQASTRHRHRHRTMTELYVVVEGRGRMRVGEDLHTLEPLSAVLVEPPTVRQLFNDTEVDQLWLIVGAPPEAANTLELTPEELAWIYPDGPKALPPELEDVRADSEVLPWEKADEAFADPSVKPVFLRNEAMQ